MKRNMAYYVVVRIQKAVKELVKWGVVTAVTGFAGGAVYEWILGE